jgi:acetyl esterase
MVISVNECDPLRDEGINFYRFLMSNGVHARCRQVMGTAHATEIFISCCPDITRDTARDIANLARGWPCAGSTGAGNTTTPVADALGGVY